MPFREIKTFLFIAFSYLNRLVIFQYYFYQCLFKKQKYKWSFPNLGHLMFLFSDLSSISCSCIFQEANMASNYRNIVKTGSYCNHLLKNNTGTTTIIPINYTTLVNVNVNLHFNHFILSYCTIIIPLMQK